MSLWLKQNNEKELRNMKHTCLLLHKGTGLSRPTRQACTVMASVLPMLGRGQHLELSRQSYSHKLFNTEVSSLPPQTQQAQPYLTHVACDHTVPSAKEPSSASLNLTKSHLHLRPSVSPTTSSTSGLLLKMTAWPIFQI